MVLRGLPGSRTVQADTAAAQAGGLGANGEQSVDIVLCVGMARRMQGLRAARKAQGGKAVVLRDHNVAGAQVRQQQIVRAVVPAVRNKDLHAGNGKDMRRVAEQQTRHMEGGALPHGLADDGAAVRIDQNAHGLQWRGVSRPRLSWMTLRGQAMAHMPQERHLSA